MKKIVIVASVTLNIILLFFAGPKLAEVIHTSLATAHQSDIDHGKAVVRIAILTPVTHPSLEKIEQGFKETLSSLGKRDYHFDVFNANGNKTLLRAQAEEIVQKDYDLIFTIATQPSQLIKELCTKKGKKTPIVFGAIAADEPERSGLVQSLQIPGGTMTGVIDGAEYQAQIDLLKVLKPSVKQVLLVYNPGTNSGFARQKEIYEKICVGYGIAFRTIEVFATNEVYAKLTASITGADAVLVLKDNTVVPAIDGVIKLCNMHHVTLMTSDLASGDKGAALSFGVYEEQYGIQGARLALKILEEGADPATLACLDAGDHKLKINTKTMGLQGLSVPQDLLLLLKSVIVI